MGRVFERKIIDEASMLTRYTLTARQSRTKSRFACPSLAATRRPSGRWYAGHLLAVMAVEAEAEMMVMTSRSGHRDVDCWYRGRMLARRRWHLPPPRGSWR